MKVVIRLDKDTLIEREAIQVIYSRGFGTIWVEYVNGFSDTFTVSQILEFKVL